MRPTSFLRTAAALLLAPIVFSACSSGEPDDPGPGEEELITRVEVMLINEDDSQDEVRIVASDPDGDGSGLTFAPTSATLRPGATYIGAIEFRDTVNDEDITSEITEEAEEHLLRYAFSPSALGSVTLLDRESEYGTTDENGGDYAVGLSFRVDVAAEASGTGTLDVLLYHFDDAPKTSSTATSDEIDVDLSFPVAFSVPLARESR